MKIKIYSDDTVDIDLGAIVTGLSINAPSIEWSSGNKAFQISDEQVAYPKTYKNISKKILEESRLDDFVFLFTEKPYDNNYFWDSGSEKNIIVSLFGWNQLTNLPRNNGAIYFITALLVRLLGIGKSHRGNNTGCINDFWQDKTGVDSGMRAAYICNQCLPLSKRKASNPQYELLQQISTVLDHLSSASRANEDICKTWARSEESSNFQVFLCHNSQDKDEIRNLNKILKAKNVKAWLDEEQLPPGWAWQELLEQQIGEIGAVAVCVGESGLGPWQNSEMRAFISEFVDRRCPVIPVILKSCKNVPQLPIFLRQFTWVDFRKPEPDPIDRLIWGITGKKPKS